MDREVFREPDWEAEEAILEAIATIKVLYWLLPEEEPKMAACTEEIVQTALRGLKNILLDHKLVIREESKSGG